MIPFGALFGLVLFKLRSRQTSLNTELHFAFIRGVARFVNYHRYYRYPQQLLSMLSMLRVITMDVNGAITDSIESIDIPSSMASNSQ